MLRLVALLLMIIPAYAMAWTPPIGIPTPTWPSDLDIALPGLPSPWTSEKTGFYYVERSASGCSDSRSYGYPGSPRCSLPSSPAAGSVIAVHGTYNTYASITWTGTSGSPIWIRAYNASAKPTISSYWTLDASYLIVDGLNWNYNARDGNEIGGNYQMVRNCSYANPYDSANGAGFATYGSNTVFYKNAISQMGNWQYSGSSDIDRHGIKVAEGTNNLWIVDSSFYHCHGDGIQVGDQTNASNQINRVYIGKNVAYENYQSCFWTKNATDVIFSQNICHDITFPAGASALGQGMGGQYDPKYIWFLFNKIYNTKTGIMIASSSSGGGGPWYAVGNILYNILSEDSGCNEYNYGAISFRNEGGFTVSNNTIYDVDTYLALPSSSGTVTAKNNLFAAQKIQSCPAVQSPGRAPTMDYNLYQSDSYKINYSGGSYSSVSGFASAKSQESHKVIGDPKLSAPPTNFALQTGSPAIGKADQTIESAYTAFQSRYGVSIQYDFNGVPRPQGTWDIGALENGITGGTAPAIPTGFKIISPVN
jgi:hypothetical protein